MRTHKFRGFSKKLNKWVVGSLINRPSPFIVGEVVESCEEYIGLEFCKPVEPESVGQFTGLHDKKGKEIFEGDIVKFEDIGEEGYEYKDGYDFTNTASVCFVDGRFELENFKDENSAVFEEFYEHDELVSTLKKSEVIGNIHKNPELLKGEGAV